MVMNNYKKDRYKKITNEKYNCAEDVRSSGGKDVAASTVLLYLYDESMQGVVHSSSHLAHGNSAENEPTR